MRQLGIAGDYYFEFRLRVMPRRGDERMIHGRMWGSRNVAGAITRVSLQSPEAAGQEAERRFLIQNGRKSAVWRWDAGGSVAMLGVGSLFEPLVPEADLTAFDLQMPFLFWDDFSYEGVARFRGRPAHVLVLRPPAEFAAKYPALAGVRVHLDTQFNALVQTEMLNRDGKAVKTLSVVDLKKIDEQWIVKTIDVRDETTRNKTRFSVVAAALGLDFSRVVFEPGQLDQSVEPPRAGGLVRIEP
jgi:Negative regulator of sigma E activity